MLSEAHNANFISFWLKEFIRLGGKIPNKFASDMSLALLNAAVTSFTTQPNLKSYIKSLFVLNFDTTAPRPECFIRIDIAHLLKAIASSKHLTNLKPRARQTYIRCIGLMMKETDIAVLRLVIFAVIIRATTATEGMSVLKCCS